MRKVQSKREVHWLLAQNKGPRACSLRQERVANVEESPKTAQLHIPRMVLHAFKAAAETPISRAWTWTAAPSDALVAFRT